MERHTQALQQQTVWLAMSSNKNETIAKDNGDKAKRGDHKPETLKRITGVSQTNYDSWRRALKGAPSGHFSDGDLLGYAVIQHLILKKRVTLPVLKPHGAKFIFEVCNFSFDTLTQYSIMYDWTTDELFLHHKEDDMPDTDPYDLAVAPLDKLMQTIDDKWREGRNKADKTLIEKDVMDLARMRKKFKRGDGKDIAKSS